MSTQELYRFLCALLIAACVDGGDGPIGNPEDMKDRTVSEDLDASAIETTYADFDCDALFGLPNASTGLDSDQCKPECDCGTNVWRTPDYDAHFLLRLKDSHHDNPPIALEQDPYEHPENHPEQPGKLCGVVPNTEAKSGRFSYRVETYESFDALQSEGAELTHSGACGQCSSLKDLAVYIEISDLTNPVRECGVDNFGNTPQEHIACLEQLGFTRACAQIWYFNTLHTRDVCFETCLALIESPYHDESGELNACILCDEMNSGPVFKAVSGRTRRNSGLPTALCRPCSTISPIEHDYGLL